MPMGIYPRTKEQYRKIGLANAIKLKGRNKSEETKKNMRIGQQKRKERLGYVNSPETRAKISEIWKQKWARGEVTERQRMHIKNYGVNTQFKKGHSVDKMTREAVRQNRLTQIFPKNDTKIEVKIQDFLKQLGIEFFTHQYIRDIEHGYQCDIFIPSIKLIIECDGDYWHGNNELYKDEQLSEKILKMREKDKLRTEELINKGFKVLRLWENEIKVIDIQDFKNKLKGMI